MRHLARFLLIAGRGGPVSNDVAASARLNAANCGKSGMLMVLPRYSFELKNDLSELSSLQQHLKTCGQVFGLSDDCLFEIHIGLDELFTNIVLYGFKDELQHQVKFTIKMDNDLLAIQVEDEGIPFNPLEARDPEIPLDVATVKIGGLGIYLIKKLMDDICYKRYRGKNKLTLRKQLKPPTRISPNP